MIDRHPITGDLALKLVMQDVLEGMKELATMVGWEAASAGWEILSIEPPQATAESRPSADILPFPRATHEYAAPRRAANQ